MCPCFADLPLTRTVPIPSINCLSVTFTRLDDELGAMRSVSTNFESAEKWSHQISFLAISEGAATNTYQARTSAVRSGHQLWYHVILIWPTVAKMSSDLLQRRLQFDWVAEGHFSLGKMGLILRAVIKREHLKTIIMCHLSLYSSNCCLIAKCGLNTISSISRLQNWPRLLNIYIYICLCGRHCNQKFTQGASRWAYKMDIHSYP